MNAPPRAPAQRRSRKATIASREKLSRCSLGPEHGAPDGWSPNAGAVDELLATAGGLVLVAGDLLDDHAALLVELAWSIFGGRRSPTGRSSASIVLSERTVMWKATRSWEV
jgi:hypothetical protein